MRVPAILRRWPLRRRPALPQPARVLLGLDPDARVLAWSPLVGGGWAVATAEALRAVLPTGVLIDRPWTDVDHVAWDEDSGMLAVWMVDSRLPVPVELAQPSFLPEVVHERVRASLVLVQEVELGGGQIARVALRQAADGTLATQVILPRGTRLADPDAAQVAQVRARLREEAGLGPAG